MQGKEAQPSAQVQGGPSQEIKISPPGAEEEPQIHVDLTRFPDLAVNHSPIKSGRIIGAATEDLFSPEQLVRPHDSDLYDNLGEPIYGPEGQELLRQFCLKRGIKSLDIGSMYYEPWQTRCCLEIVKSFKDEAALTRERHGFLVRAPTGSGKSVAAMFLIAWALDRNLDVLLTTPQEALVRQFGRFARSFLRIPEECVAELYEDPHANLALLSGDLSSPNQRPMLYADPRRKLFIATPNVIANDLKPIDSNGDPRKPPLDPKRFWGLIIDEAHHAVKKNPAAQLARELARDLNLVVLMSATPASTNQGRRELEQRFGLSRYLRFKPKRVPWRERTVQVSLDGPQWSKHRRALHLLKEAALGTEYRIERAKLKQHPQLEFSDLKRSYSSRSVSKYQFPTMDQIEKQIKDLPSTFPIQHDMKVARGQLEELRQLKRLHDLILNQGALAFLTAAGRVLASAKIDFVKPFTISRGADGKLSCTELQEAAPAGRIPKIERRKWWEFILARDKRVREAFRVLSEGTPFEFLLRTERWGQLFSKSQCASEGSIKTRAAALRNFFNAATLHYVAKRGFSDHPKLLEIGKEILAFAQSRPGERGIVTTQTREYAIYYQTFINYHLNVLWGLKATSITGKGAHALSPLTAQDQHRRFQEFRDSSRIAVATSVIEEGHDVPKASWIIVTRVNKEPVRIQQLRGRAGRPGSSKASTVQTAEIVYIIDRDGLDQHILNTGRRKIREMEG